METENFIWYEKPELDKPYMIMAFTGWTNAAEVPSSVLWYLISRLEATLYAEIKPDEFFNYQAAGSENKRPLVSIEDGIIRSYSLITSNFWYHKDNLGGHDIIIVSGPEPEQGWNKYSECILDIVQEYEVQKIITIGGIFDAITHTAPPRITAAVSRSDLKDAIKEQGIELINYKGHSSIHTLLMLEAHRKNIPMINLWAHTPHYIKSTNFIACYHMMLKLSELLELQIDLEVARKDSEFLYSKIEQAIGNKPELQEYLRKLKSKDDKGISSKQNSINKNIIQEIEDLFNK